MTRMKLNEGDTVQNGVGTTGVVETVQQDMVRVAFTNGQSGWFSQVDDKRLKLI